MQRKYAEITELYILWSKLSCRQPSRLKKLEWAEAGVAYSSHGRQRMAILLLQLWQGFQVCVKIFAQLPPEASPI